MPGSRAADMLLGAPHASLPLACQVELIPDRQVCWAGYFKRRTNTGVHSGHPSAASFACIEPHNIYDTVAPFYFDQLRNNHT